MWSGTAPAAPRRLQEVLPAMVASGTAGRRELWWGGPCQGGMEQPYGWERSDEEAGPHDNVAWEVDLAALRCNQSNPLLVSSEGRFVWCGDSACHVAVGLRDGRVCVEGDTVEGVAVGEGHGNLAGALRAAAQRHFPPTGLTPDAMLLSAPQYNLWIECNYWPTQDKVLQYARQVVAHGMPPGVLMVDTNWAEHYGSFHFNGARFPDPRAMAEELHALGFKLMVWLTPFVSPDSITFRLLESQGMLLPGPKGSPGISHWWDGYSAMLDALNPAAVSWFEAGLEALREMGVDGFKMDGGDPEYYAQVTGESTAAALRHTEAFAAIGLRYRLTEYRACWKHAGTHLTQRLCDKNHAWDGSGLASLIPNGAAQGLSGYAFGCPDMIGGGQYSDFYHLGTLEPRFDIDQELFVRYAQVSALFPMMQFSLAPWRVLDGPHLAACAEAAALHGRHAPLIAELAAEAARSGAPILRHMEYEFPQQGYAHVHDQFLLGPDVLAAPILVKGASSRAVRIPPGRWRGAGGAAEAGCLEGPQEVRVRAVREASTRGSVALEPLLYFVREAPPE
eukprot:jgi/Tetstr1/466306/TSEL_010839.t1